MREIKFRVWIKVSQKIVSWKMIKEKKNLHRLIENPEYLLMQYTGLKDKNGIEIYEGDIVNHDGFIGYVAYINSGNCNVLGYALSSLINNRIFYMFCDEVDNYEVIGNIYENKDLLIKAK